MIRRLSTIAALTALLSSGDAAAHGVDQPPTGRQPFVIDGELLGAATNYGLLLRDVDNPERVYRWTPEETLDAVSRTGWYYREGGDVLMATSDGLFQTEDGGCSWGEVSGPLKGRGITSLVHFPDRRERLLATTESGEGANGVFESEDGGSTWSRAGLSGNNLLFRRVRVQGHRAWVDALDRDEDRTRVWWSDTRGNEWNEVSMTKRWERVRLVGPAGDNVFLAAREGRGWVLLRANHELKEIFEVTRFRHEPLEAARLSRWMMVTTADGEAFFVNERDVDEIAQEIDCLRTGVTENEVWACASTAEADGHFLRFRRRDDIVVALPWEEVEPRGCPDDTPGEALVDDLWPTLQRQGIGPASDEGSGDDGCACSTPAGGRTPHTIVILLLAAGVFVRRLSRRDT